MESLEPRAVFEGLRAGKLRILDLRTKAERMGHLLHHQGVDVDEEMLRASHARDR